MKSQRWNDDVDAVEEDAMVTETRRTISKNAIISAIIWLMLVYSRKVVKSRNVTFRRNI